MSESQTGSYGATPSSVDLEKHASEGSDSSAFFTFMRAYYCDLLMIFSAGGSAFVAIAISYLGEHADPAEQLICQSLVKGPILCLIVFYTRSRSGSLIVDREDHLRAKIGLLVQGLMGGLAQVCFFFALVEVRPGVAVSIIYSEALFVSFFAHLFSGEAYSWKMFLATLIALGGAFLIGGNSAVDTLGCLAAFGDALLYSGWLLVTRYVVPKENLWLAQLIQVPICIIVPLVVCIAKRIPDFSRALQLLLFMGTENGRNTTTSLCIWATSIVSLIQMFVSQLAIRSCPKGVVARVISWIYLTPIIVFLVDAIHGSEDMSTSVIVGILMIFAALGANSVLARTAGKDARLEEPPVKGII